MNTKSKHPMRIAMIHDAVIPPPLYGGTERVIAWLCEELIQRGHQVRLYSKPESKIAGAELRPFHEWENDIIHDSSIDLFHFWASPAQTPKRPYLVTIEGNGQPGERFRPNTVFVSRRHAEIHSSTHYVYNGIKTSFFECNSVRNDDLVFLAKASWNVKNLEGAIQLAYAVNRPLRVLGSRTWPLHAERWLNRFRLIKYFGMVNDQEKREHLSSAYALLFPVRWEEPFGIALTESLASGCPVYGTPYGSLPEIISPEVGALSADGSTLVKALQGKRPDSLVCRHRAETLFGVEAMTDSYLKYYERILKNGPLTDEQNTPQTRFDFNAKNLLAWTQP